MTSTTPTPTPIPALAAIFLTHFNDTKGQSVIYYRSFDETRLPKGTIEHTTLPSGLHLVEEDFFGFTHHLVSSEAGPSSRSHDTDLPGVGLFRSRIDEQSRGRGRRMVTLGVVLADPYAGDELFELKSWLSGIYDEIENDNTIIEGLLSSQSDQIRKEEGQQRLDKILDDQWEKYGSTSIPTDGEVPRAKSMEKLRNLADGRGDISPNNPIKYLQDLVDILGPQFITIYKAAISGRRILIYSPPPLLPVSAYGWCISSISLPPTSTSTIGVSKWLGQVGLMDLEGLLSRKGAWVANKILLSHTKAYDLSIDLSTHTLNESEGSGRKQVDIRYTSPKSSTPISTTYQFSDIPLYKSLLHPTSSINNDWWLTIYDLVDRVWLICTGVCEYAVGRGRVGQVSLGLGEDESPLLQDEEDEDMGKEDEDGRRGRMILRQLYHQTYHLDARLRAVRGQDAGVPTMGEVRELSGKWLVKNEDIQFWQDLNRHWGQTQVEEE